MNDEMNSYATALAAFQADLPKVSKASQGNRGRYADLADVSSTVLPLLAKQGLSWSACPTITEDGFVLRYTLRHVNGGFETGDYPLPSPTEPPQTLGSAITYAKRYALCAISGVAPDNDDDDGAHATENHRARPPAQRRNSAPAKTAATAPSEIEVAKEKLRYSCKENGWDPSIVADLFSGEQGSELKDVTDPAVVEKFRASLFALPSEKLKAAA